MVIMILYHLGLCRTYYIDLKLYIYKTIFMGRVVDLLAILFMIIDRYYDHFNAVVVIELFSVIIDT